MMGQPLSGTIQMKLKRRTQTQALRVRTLSYRHLHHHLAQSDSFAQMLELFFVQYKIVLKYTIMVYGEWPTNNNWFARYENIGSLLIEMIR